MRRVLAVVLSVFAILAFAVPGADAQAPAAKVTINGLVDNITSYTSNLSVVDLNYNRAFDKEWYARTRVRPDITGEVGTTKFVLGLEIDATWGQTGATDITAPNRSGTSHSWDLNTDALGPIEVKWAYTEFDMPGVPFATRVRLGAQAWGAVGTYKLAALANGDFAGANLVATFAPNLKWNFTYAQVEEDSTGFSDGFGRNDDYAIVTSLDITPFKGLDIKPVFSVFSATGVTAGASRTPKGGLGVGQAGATGITLAGLNTFLTPYNAQTHESRYTIGVDARLRMGPFSLDPTILWQAGDRDIVSAFTDRIEDQNLNAWLIDIRGGYQTGPLLLEGAFIWTTGNSANSDVRKGGTTIRYYQPISTDTSYYATWAEHWALGIDYFGIIYSTAPGLNPGASIGYDKYGLLRLGARASYAVTPAFTVRAAVTSNWTDEDVDSGGTLTAGAGIIPCRQARAGDARGADATGQGCPQNADGSSYLGTELDLGFQWRFAPGLTFDVVGAYTWTGEAMANRLVTSGGSGGTFRGHDPEDITTLHVRLRYNF